MRIVLYRLLAVLLPLALLEILCRDHVITPLTLPAPSRILLGLWTMMENGAFNAAILKTLTNVSLAFVLSVVAGIAAGAAIHRARLLRALLEPLFSTYYAIPIYAFYPLFIVVFGLGDAPQVLIGFMLAVVSMIVSTLAGLDSVPAVLGKTARVLQLSPVATVRSVTLPYAAPYLFTGVKLAVAYAFIGVIGAEFIMSGTGLGYEIRFAYDNLDNNVMYPLILLILLIAVAVNMSLDRWERALRARRGRG
ncbi:ABC transporter permease [Bradyrhizobium sp.]|uniref:ABC transporter permease n=1 Tax=Bradyrhizobium sp. TaxID=376 RepID=UPI003C76E7F8